MAALGETIWMEQALQALMVLRVQAHQPREAVDAGGENGTGDDLGHGPILHIAPVPQQD
jgi:hypothetical protein